MTMTIKHWFREDATDMAITEAQHAALINAKLVYDATDGEPGDCRSTTAHMEACNHDVDSAVRYIEGFLHGTGLPYPEPDDVRHANAKLTWDGPTDSDDEPCFFINHYHCDDCDEEWTDQWSCGCDDECPTCGHDIEPYDSVDVTEIPDTCPACGKEHDQ